MTKAEHIESMDSYPADTASFEKHDGKIDAVPEDSELSTAQAPDGTTLQRNLKARHLTMISLGK